MSIDEFDDEFDDDIADEDFITALDQASSSVNRQSLTSSGSGTFKTALPVKSHHQQTPRAAASLELADLPSDAFDSSPEPVSQTAFSRTTARAVQTPRNGFARTASGNFRQTTLWGGEVVLDRDETVQTNQVRGFRADSKEAPSHHELVTDEMKTWVYPTNLGAIRDYQFSIVKNSLFNNTLVALPTGLGKTFIAATVMLNFYRWTKSAKIVFVAPTKPLVSQQVGACYSIAGIPRSETTLLTGDVSPALRVDEWKDKRVFFMTPQTLMNDLSHGYADPKSIVLLVVDEAHRATGEYAYAKVAKMIRRFSKSIRVLALTATPGSKLETVQEVIDNLGISHCEIRTEDSLDIRQYVHQRNVDQIVLDPSDEMHMLSELFTEALKPLTEKLSAQNIWYGRNPMALTTFGLLQQQKEWFATRGHHANQGVQFMMRAIFTVLTGIAHSIKLLQYHGIKPFFDNMRDFRSEQESKGEKGSKYKRQIIENPKFQEMMDKMEMWLKHPDFVGHPKLSSLAETVLNHLVDHGEATRIIVFSEYRDSAEEIVRMLNKHKPLVKARVFVGQADSKRAEGMKQAQQIETIEKFRKGEFNVLVATSIGEEGLDIGQVDLIVCYDSSASPIRMLQRMGRTGRKRAGNIVLLLMRGKEEDQFARSKDNYEKMQQLICEGSRFNFRFDLSTRIVPRDIRPEVDKRHVDIPVENTQDPSLPEPKKRRPTKKKPPKKFHMPEGVETGFQKLSDMLRPGNGNRGPGRPKKAPPNLELEDLAPIPELKSVLLNREDLEELDRSYRDLPFNRDSVEETDMPSLNAFPELQRSLRPVHRVKHGRYTKTCVHLMKKMGNSPDSLVRPCRESDTSNYLEIPVPSFVDSDGEQEEVPMKSQPKSKKPSGRAAPAKARSTSVKKPPKKKRKSTTTYVEADISEGSDEEEVEEDDEDEEERQTAPKKRGRPKGKGAKGKKQKRGGGLNSDELGDDCERDSDLMDTDGSDDGADLVDFIVGDDMATSSLREPSSTIETLPDLNSRGANKREKPFYVPTEFVPTQDSEGLPDLGTVSSRKAALGRHNIQEESDPDTRQTKGRGRKSKVFESDSDE